MIKRVLIASIALVLLVLASTACNTVRGAGEDIESVGEAVQDN